MRAQKLELLTRGGGGTKEDSAEGVRSQQRLTDGRCRGTCSKRLVGNGDTFSEAWKRMKRNEIVGMGREESRVAHCKGSCMPRQEI